MAMSKDMKQLVITGALIPVLIVMVIKNMNRDKNQESSAPSTAQVTTVTETPSAQGRPEGVTSMDGN